MHDATLLYNENVLNFRIKMYLCFLGVHKFQGVLMS